MYNHAWIKQKSRIYTEKNNGIRSYSIEEINRNKLRRKKHKKSPRVLNYIEHLLIVISTITGGVSISALASLVGTPIGITGSAVGWKICAITSGINTYKSRIKKKKKKHDKIVLLTKSKFNSIEVLIFKALISSNIGHDEFFLINNVLEKNYDTKEEIQNSNDK